MDITFNGKAAERLTQHWDELNKAVNIEDETLRANVRAVSAPGRAACTHAVTALRHEISVQVWKTWAELLPFLQSPKAEKGKAFELLWGKQAYRTGKARMWNEKSEAWARAWAKAFPTVRRAAGLAFCPVHSCSGTTGTQLAEPAAARRGFYWHVLVNHGGEQIEKWGHLALWSTQALEKGHYLYKVTTRVRSARVCFARRGLRRGSD